VSKQDCCVARDLAGHGCPTLTATLRPRRIDIEAPMVHISTMNAASAVRRRLESYWKMEAACAGLFPILALAIVDLTGLRDLLALLIALLACCSLLVVGGLYWRAALRRLCGDTVPMARLLANAHRLRFWLLALCVIATTVAVAGLVRFGATSATIATAGFALLGDLEYVNYYKFQLQNFDHLADFRRLMRDRRLRPSHMARDLADYRAGARHRLD